jgi:hypothetical protein
MAQRMIINNAVPIVRDVWTMAKRLAHRTATKYESKTTSISTEFSRVEQKDMVIDIEAVTRRTYEGHNFTSPGSPQIVEPSIGMFCVL